MLRKDIYVNRLESVISGINCAFYRQEHNAKGESHELNFDGLQMQKWNIPMDRAQRVDEKNGVICLVMFTPV